MYTRPTNPIPGFSLVSDEYLRGYEAGSEDGRRCQSAELQAYRQQERVRELYETINDLSSSEDSLQTHYRFVTYTLSPEYQAKITPQLFVERIEKMMKSTNGPFRHYGCLEHTKDGVLHAHVLMAFATIPKSGLSHVHFKRMGYKWGAINVQSPNRNFRIDVQLVNFVKYIEKENFIIFGERKFPHLKDGASEGEEKIQRKEKGGRPQEN